VGVQAINRRHRGSILAALLLCSCHRRVRVERETTINASRVTLRGRAISMSKAQTTTQLFLGNIYTSWRPASDTKMIGRPRLLASLLPFDGILMNECMKKKLSTQTSKEEGNRSLLSKPPRRTYNRFEPHHYLSTIHTRSTPSEDSTSAAWTLPL